MYKNILVPVALDVEHDPAEAIAIARALKAQGGKITLLSVVEHISGYVANSLPAGQEQRNREAVEARLAQVVEGLEGLESNVIMGHPGGAIVDHAKAHDVDLIVIASHKPGLKDFFLGSTAARVVRYSQCPVHVLR